MPLSAPAPSRHCDGMDALPDALCADLLCPFVALSERFYALARVSQRWQLLAWHSIHNDHALDLTWCTGDHELGWVVSALVARASADPAEASRSKLEGFQLFGPRIHSPVLARLIAGVGCARVRRVEIESKQIDDSALLQLCVCAELTKLSLHCVKLTSQALSKIARGCLKLETLDISGCSRVCDDGVVAVALHCSYLRELNLTMCHRISDRSLARLGFRSHKTLECVVVDRCLKTSGLALRFLMQSQPRLRRLSFANCPRVHDHDFLAINKQLASASSRLESVEMSGCAQLTDSGVVALVARNAATLRSIAARSLLRLSSDAYGAIAQCSHLSDLNLSMCRTLRNADLGRIVAACELLRSLHLQACVQIDDDGAEAIARHGRKLEVLSLEFCYNVTDDGVAQIVRCCHQLVDLNLKALNQLTVEAFDSLISLKSAAAPLRRINIGACADFSTTLRYASVIKRRYPRARIEWT